MPKTKKYSPEELMRLAIEESRLSIPEHADKTDPLVGAIITTADGEILAKAHRGELRVGEHCEFTLIERKLVNHNLKDCVLYVTLEPCTDKSRSKGKRGCSTHVFKARLGQVYIGIEDPNPKIATDGIDFLEKKKITVHIFPEELQEIIRTDNAKFIEEKEKEAKQVKIQAIEKPKTILEAPATGTDIDSFSFDAVKRFVRTASMPFDYPSDDFNEWGRQFGILEEVNENIQPTGLGLMLFGSQPEIVFPQTVFKVEINYGDKNPEVRDFGGALVEQLPQILDYVRDKALKLTMDKSEGARQEQSDFPFEVLLEAVANAVIHRDYTVEGATNYLYIDRDKIIVRSPGEPPPPLTIKDLQDLDTSTVSRNPKIMYIFNQMKLAEQRGIGLARMKHLPERGFPLPIIVMKHGKLEVTFGRTTNFLEEKFGIDTLTEDEKKGLLFIQQKGEVSNSEYAEYMNIDRKAALRQLNKLIENRLIAKLGEKRWARYRPV